MYAYVTRLMHFVFEKINRKSSLLSDVKLMFESVSPHFIDNGVRKLSVLLKLLVKSSQREVATSS